MKDRGLALLRERQRRKLIERVRRSVREHIANLNLVEAGASNNGHNGAKELIRASHAAQRAESLTRERRALGEHVPRLINWFADGAEIRPAKIDPELVRVDRKSELGMVFRLCTALWSIPVSRGYGRRMRYVVIDRSNGKLIGILAIGDPVFNLRDRDDWIGWTTREREAGLVNVMDAYVVGAVPPYSTLLGGKLVASLIGSLEISRDFAEKYGDRRGVISGRRKKARLALVTVTSALGRSSLYNRLRIPGLVDVVRIGSTRGWGHFHVSDKTFRDMRRVLELGGHPYADGHGYGQGPNWKIRVIREALSEINFDQGLLNHGIRREVFAAPLAENWREYLRGVADECVLRRPTASQISEACLERWVLPRSYRRPEFADWTRENTMELLAPVWR